MGLTDIVKKYSRNALLGASVLVYSAGLIGSVGCATPNKYLDVGNLQKSSPVEFAGDNSRLNYVHIQKVAQNAFEEFSGEKSEYEIRNLSEEEFDGLYNSDTEKERAAAVCDRKNKVISINITPMTYLLDVPKQATHGLLPILFHEDGHTLYKPSKKTIEKMMAIADENIKKSFDDKKSNAVDDAIIEFKKSREKYRLVDEASSEMFATLMQNYVFLKHGNIGYWGWDKSGYDECTTMDVAERIAKDCFEKTDSKLFQLERMTGAFKKLSESDPDEILSEISDKTKKFIDAYVEKKVIDMKNPNTKFPRLYSTGLEAILGPYYELEKELIPMRIKNDEELVTSEILDYQFRQDEFDIIEQGRRYWLMQTLDEELAHVNPTKDDLILLNVGEAHLRASEKHLREKGYDSYFFSESPYIMSYTDFKMIAGFIPSMLQFKDFNLENEKARVNDIRSMDSSLPPVIVMGDVHDIIGDSSGINPDFDWSRCLPDAGELKKQGIKRVIWARENMPPYNHDEIKNIELESLAVTDSYGEKFDFFEFMKAKKEFEYLKNLRESGIEIQVLGIDYELQRILEERAAENTAEDESEK